MQVLDPAIIAANRFGYGEADAAGAAGSRASRERAAAAVMAQIAAFDPAPPMIAALEDTRAIMARSIEARAVMAAARRYGDAQDTGDAPDARADTRPRAVVGQVAPSEGSVARSPEGDSDVEAAGGAGGTAGRTMSSASAKAATLTPRQMMRRGTQRAENAQIAARLAVASTSPTPFAERMVAFWSNHFSVTTNAIRMVGLGGRLEVDAIRPRLKGRFADLLQAAVLHPAMLIYLNQDASVGPGSGFAARRANTAAKAGSAKARLPGLNENLAREILELHTLGTGRTTGGAGAAIPYGQADVTALARVLTGHVVEGRVPGAQAPMVRAALASGEASRGQMPGALFIEALHEPGAQTVLGRSFGQPGADQARAVLAMLAVHPATARHLSFKLARHFVADQPPEALVARLEARWLATGGDLAAWMETLVTSPEAWAPAPRKVRDPWDWLVGAARVLGPMKPLGGDLVGRWLRELGQPVWRSGSPQGYGDTAADWLAPDALIRRADIAPMVARAAAGVPDLRRIGPAAAGVPAKGPTMAMLEAAADPVQAAALFLMSPEFLRR